MSYNNNCNYNPIQYNVLVGSSNGGISNVSPSSTSGYVLTSNGASSNPSFQILGSLGFSVNVQVFVYAGSGTQQTYTPTSGMVYCIVELVGGGGSGGGGVGPTSSTCVASAGGGGGGYSRKIFSSSTIGASKTVVVGGGGASVAGFNTGNAGQTTSFGPIGSPIFTAVGGSGGSGSGGSALHSYSGGAGGSGSGGDVNFVGGAGTNSILLYDSGSSSYYATSGSLA